MFRQNYSRVADAPKSMMEPSSQRSLSQKTVGNRPSQTNPEMRKLNLLIQKVYEEELQRKTFWSTKRRRQLHEISKRVLVACGIAGAVLTVLALLWYRNFVNIYNLYPVTYVNIKTSESQDGEVKTSFIGDIKNAERTFSEYFMGAFLLIEGSLCANTGRHSSFKYRSWWYIGASLVLLVSIAFIVAAPLLSILATNNQKEINQLRTDEYKAYSEGLQGSIKFFREYQCQDVKKFAKENGSTEEITIGRMNFFCEILTRLVYCLYFMLFTAIIPLLAIVICWLEVIVNKRNWDMKAAYQYIPKQPEQTVNDKSKTGPLNPMLKQGESELEKMF